MIALRLTGAKANRLFLIRNPLWSDHDNKINNTMAGNQRLLIRITALPLYIINSFLLNYAITDPEDNWIFNKPAP